VNTSATAAVNGRLSLPRLVVSNGTIEGLKWVGLLLMTGDHVNKYLFAEQLPGLSELGRLAMPIFGFVLAYNLARAGALEGGAYPRAIKRLAVWGAVASVPYTALGTVLGGWWPLNILFTLTLAAVVMYLVEVGGMARVTGALLVFLVGGAFVEFWWPSLALCLAWWAYCKRSSGWRLAAIIAAAASLWLINRNLWAVAAVPLVLLAPAIDVAIPRLRYVFYAYYPAHLATLWAARKCLS
jgi:TraX protein